MGEFRENIPSATYLQQPFSEHESVSGGDEKQNFSPADFSSKSRATSILRGLGTNISVRNAFKKRYCITLTFLAAYRRV